LIGGGDGGRDRRELPAPNPACKQLGPWWRLFAMAKVWCLEQGKGTCPVSAGLG